MNDLESHDVVRNKKALFISKNMQLLDSDSIKYNNSTVLFSEFKLKIFSKFININKDINNIE